MHWVTATRLDFATLLFGLAAVLLIGAALGVVFATRAQRRRERRSEEGRMAPENAREVALARWIEEGRQLFNIWQERVERFDELQGRLAAMARRSVSSAVGLTGCALRTSTSAKKVRLSCWSGTNCDPFSLASAS